MLLYSGPNIFEHGKKHPWYIIGIEIDEVCLHKDVSGILGHSELITSDFCLLGIYTMYTFLDSLDIRAIV